MPFSRLSPFPWRLQYRMGALPSWSSTSPSSPQSATWPTCPSSPSSSAQQVKGQLKSFSKKIKISGSPMFVFYGVYLLAKKVMKRKGFQTVSQNDTQMSQNSEKWGEVPHKLFKLFFFIYFGAKKTFFQMVPQ